MVSNKACGSGVFWSNPDPVIEIRLGPFSKFDRIRIDQSDNTVLILKKNYLSTERENEEVNFIG